MRHYQVVALAKKYACLDVVTVRDVEWLMIVMKVSLKTMIDVYLMQKNGYIVADDYDHYPGFKPRTIDRFFVKKKYLDSWRKFKLLK